MNDVQSTRPSTSPLRRDSCSLPLLLLLFICSGCSALIYEIVWFQLLQLVIGSSAVSIGVLLGTFMGGMCLGSLALPRFVSSSWHPLRVYGALELSIGLFGLGLLFVVPSVGRLYTDVVGYGLPGVILRGAICALCLLPPTMLMGATLPAIARWVETSSEGVSRLGFFYGANIIGAVLGCLLAGFYLLRLYDVLTATYVAAAINVLAGAAALLLARWYTYGARQVPVQNQETASCRGSAHIYVAIALSGMCALGAEVVWTRQLSLLLGATVYTFSIILAVFLVGLAIGSGAGAMLSRGSARPALLLGYCQLMLCCAIAWTAHSLARSLPYWPIDPSLSTTPWFNFQLDLMRCLWAIFPATCLWGASFPLALAAVARPGQDSGRLVAGVYSANTVGAILGAIGFSMLFIGALGTQTSQQLLIGLSGLTAILVAVPSIWTAIMKSRRISTGLAAPVFVIPIAAMSAIAGWMIWLVPEPPRALIAYGRYTPITYEEDEFIYVHEGMNASLAISQSAGGVRNFHVSGKVVASSDVLDMRLQRMLGHLPALIHARPRSVLVVGCGAGVTAGSFVLHPDIERIVICEIEPTIPSAAGEYFGEYNDKVMDDPRVEVIHDDARHFIVSTKEKFDIITSDPIHPWVKGAAALYSKEYFELCKQHLNPGGVVTQWVPLYETTLPAVKSEIATFFDAYPGGTIWSNDDHQEGYDIVLLGQVGQTRVHVDALRQRLARDDHQDVLESLQEVELGSAIALLSTYAGRADDLSPWLADAEMNYDRNLRLQYLAGMGLNEYREIGIYDELVRFRKYPSQVFVVAGSEERQLRSNLRNSMGESVRD